MAIAPAPVLLEATAHSVAFTVVEDGNAVDVVQIDVPAVAATGPLADAIAGIFANQAAALAFVRTQCDIVVYREAGTQAGATAGAMATVIANISGGAAGNFRLDVASEKAANADTATYFVRLALRHSIND